jgi:chromosome partitioning protein
MIVTVASFKGGVGKTTTAVHLADYLNRRAPTVLVDGDPNRSATGWQKRGALPFKVIDERAVARYAKEFEHLVIDTEAHPKADDLRALCEACDLLVLPTTPDALALEALELTVNALADVGAGSYRVLLTIIPPRPSRDGEDAREMLRAKKHPVFKGMVRRRIAFQKAALAGVPVYEANDQRASDAWNDYLTIGREIIK